MPIDASWRAFTDDEIEKAPLFHGVYGLYYGVEPIYYGRAEGLEGIVGRLNSHKAGREGSGTMKASYFNYEMSVQPAARERELLAEHKSLYDQLPRCNSVMR